MLDFQDHIAFPTFWGYNAAVEDRPHRIMSVGLRFIEG